MLGNARSTVKCVGLNAWQCESIVKYVSLDAWDCESTVKYVGLNAWEVHFVYIPDTILFIFRMSRLL